MTDARTGATSRPPAVSVIVPVFNKLRWVGRSADSIMIAARHAHAEVVFVDHGSTDGSREVLARHHDALVLDHLGGTVGAVRNAGARRANGEIICFIDCDVVVQPDHFDRVARVLAATGAGAVGCEVDISPERLWLESTWHALHARRSSGYRRWINAANLAVRRDVFEALGGFDERLVSAEENDLCRRLLLAGHTIYEAQELSAIHLDNPRTLASFFRQQHWHGLGVRATGKNYLSNKPMLMAAANLAALTAALLVLLVPTRLGWTVRWLGAAGAALAVPTLAYVYRLLQTGRWVNPVRALPLLEAYLLARGVALVRLVGGRV